MPSLFTKIANGEIPSYTIAENEHAMAFLDIQPLAIGHTLVVPKIEVDYYFDLDNENYFILNAFAKKIAIAIKSSIPCKRVGVAVIGLEIPHAHIHLIPINDVSDINFSKEKLHPNDTIMKQTAMKIKSFL